MYSIVITYGSLATLHSAGPIDLVVDNSGFLDMSQSNVIRPERNLGWVPAANLGLRRGLRLGPQSPIALLNDDLWIHSSNWRELLSEGIEDGIACVATMGVEVARWSPRSGGR